MTDEIRKCRRCDKPVIVHFEKYYVFENMHWLCFHLEYEHGETDPDTACGDPSCPWWQIEVYKEAVKEIFEGRMSERLRSRKLYKISMRLQTTVNHFGQQSWDNIRENQRDRLQFLKRNEKMGSVFTRGEMK